MTRCDDYQNEMPASRPLDDTTVELLLAGTPVGDEDLVAVTAFVADLRTSAVTPPPPSAALAAVLAEGPKTVDTSGAPVGAGSAPRRLRAGIAHRRTGMLRTRVSGLAARLGAAGLATKVAFGATMAAASVTAAGAAGVLPDAVQQAVAGVVRAVTPFQFPDPAGGQRDVGVGTDPHTDDGGDVNPPSTADTSPASEEHGSDPPRQPTPGTTLRDSESPDRNEPGSAPGDEGADVPDGTFPTEPGPPADTPNSGPTPVSPSPPQSTPTTAPGSAPVGQPGPAPTSPEGIPSQPPAIPGGQPEQGSGSAVETPRAIQPSTTSTTQATQLPIGRR